MLQALRRHALQKTYPDRADRATAVSSKPCSVGLSVATYHLGTFPSYLLTPGVDVVSDKRKLTYPAGRHGYCGDAYNQRRWDVPGQTQASYVQGQQVSVDFVIATNHLGRIDMTVCDLDAKPGDKKCRSLQRYVNNHTFVVHQQLL